MMTAEQIMAAQKTQLETLFGLSAKAFEGMEKLVDLNMQTAKAAFSESAEAARAMLAAKDAKEVLTLQATMVQPTAEKALSYGRQVYDITTGTTAEVGKLAESRMAEVQQSVFSAVDNGGNANASTFVKSAMAAANNAYDTVQKAAKQAVEATDANIKIFGNNAAKATQAVTQG